MPEYHGYQGYVKIAGTYVLCTSSGLNFGEDFIRSSSMYGATEFTEGDEAAISQPKIRDYVVASGSIQFDIGKSRLGLLKSLIQSRDASFDVFLSSRGGEGITYSDCLWNSLSISCGGEGSILNVSLNIVSYTHAYEFSNGAEKCESKYPSDLMADGSDCIPFWMTSLSICSKLLSWSVSFSQNVIPYYCCEAVEEPAPPKFIGVGILNIRANTVSLEEMPNTGNIDVLIDGDSVFKLLNCVRVGFSDNISGSSQLSTVSADYEANGISF